MKKLNQRGVAHHGFIAFVLVAIVLASSGFLVFKSQNNNTASAQNWTNLSSINGANLEDDSRIMACKFQLKRGLPSWVVRLRAHNENYIGDFSGSFEVVRDGQKVGQVTASAEPYSVGRVKTTNFVIRPNDQWTGYITFRAGAVLSFGGPWSFEKIANC